MNSLCSPFTVNPLWSPSPPTTPLFLRKKEPEKLESLNRIGGKEPVSGLSTLFNVRLTGFLPMGKGKMYCSVYICLLIR